MYNFNQMLQEEIKITTDTETAIARGLIRASCVAHDAMNLEF